MNKHIWRIFLVLVPILFYATHVSAHVAYVLPENEFNALKGPDPNFLANAIFSFQGISIILINSIVVVFLVWFSSCNKKIVQFIRHTRKKLESYHEFIPWIIRLSLGIALIGAGTSQVLVSPVIQGVPMLSTFQIFLGFMYLLGFLLVPTTLVTIALYIFSLSYSGYLIGNLDMLALAFGFLVFHSGRPGLDDIIGYSFLPKLKINREYLAPILRFGIGGAMIFLACYEKLFNPHVSEAVVLQYGLNHVIAVSPALWVAGAGLVELIVGLCLFFGFYTRLAACIAFLVLSLSFFFFKESVYSHVTLFGLLSILVIEGGGMWSLDVFRKQREQTLEKVAHLHSIP